MTMNKLLLLSIVLAVLIGGGTSLVYNLATAPKKSEAANVVCSCLCLDNETSVALCKDFYQEDGTCPTMNYYSYTTEEACFNLNFDTTEVDVLGLGDIKKPAACVGFDKKNDLREGTWANCGKTDFNHLECVNRQCVPTKNSGESTCKTDDDCVEGFGGKGFEQIMCYRDSDCGTNGFTAYPLQCVSGDKVWQIWMYYVTWTCGNPGTTKSSCSASTQLRFVKECLPNDECEDGKGCISYY